VSRANQAVHVVTARDHPARDVRADETGRAGDEDASR
jgi:hypothetical protein